MEGAWSGSAVREMRRTRFAPIGKATIGAALLSGLTLLGTEARADLQSRQPAPYVGEVRTGVPLTHRFTFVNTGPEVVEITDARASCGCLAPRLAKRTYQPGE